MRGKWLWIALLVAAPPVARAQAADPFENDGGTETPPVTAPPPAVTRTHAPRTEVPPPEVCPPADFDRAHEELLCVETRDGRIGAFQLIPKDTRVLAPGKHLRVIVQHDSAARPEVRVEAAFGVWRPETRGEGPRGDSVTPAKVVKRTSTRFLLPPMLPPVAKVTLRLLDDGSGEERDAQVLDFVVQRSYAGAVRLGIAAITGGAIGTPFVVTTLPGASTAEIVRGKANPAEFEMTVGYAAFLEEGGRPESGCSGTGCLAPFIALGVVGQGSRGLDFLSSVHAGVEYELGPGFAVALTVAFRRVDRLLPQFAVSQAVAPGSTITAPGLGIGGAVVINVNPAFFRQAVDTASGR